MGFASEVGLTAGRELRRALASARGVALLVLFLLGGTGGSLLYIKASQYNVLAAVTDARFTPEQAAEIMAKAKLEALKQVYPEATAVALAACPSVLLFLFKGTMLVLPLLALMLGFDVVAGDVQHRTIRYLVGRASRPALVVGKALGLWTLLALITLMMHATIWLAAMFNHEGTFAQVYGWGLRWWALSLGGAACATGLTTLVSSAFRTPPLALVSGVALQFGLWMLGLIVGFLTEGDAVTSWLPGKVDGLLVSHDPVIVASAVVRLLAWSAAFVGGAVALVKWRDV